MSQSVGETIKSIIAQHTELTPDKLGDDARLDELGVHSLELVEIINLPDSMQPVEFVKWLEGKDKGRSPGTWFTSTGNAADLDGDGTLEFLVAVAKGDFAIELQGRLKKTDNIVDFVKPKVPLKLADQFLPHKTELLHYIR